MITAKNGPIDPEDFQALELGDEIVSPDCCCCGCRSAEDAAVAIALEWLSYNQSKIINVGVDIYKGNQGSNIDD